MQKITRHLAALTLVAGGTLLGACGGDDGGADDLGSTEERIDALNQRIEDLEEQIDELRDAAESLGATEGDESEDGG